jgi:hypothetical protein
LLALETCLPTAAARDPAEGTAGAARAAREPIVATACPTPVARERVEAASGPSRAVRAPAEATALQSLAAREPIEATAGPCGAAREPLAVTACAYSATQWPFSARVTVAWPARARACSNVIGGKRALLGRYHPKKGRRESRVRAQPTLEPGRSGHESGRERPSGRRTKLFEGTGH